MTEDLNTIEQMQLKEGVTALHFRILPILKDALELYKMDNHYPSSTRDLYAYLVHENFYQAYQSIFDRVIACELPSNGLIQVEELQHFGITANRYAMICAGTKRKFTVNVPKSFILVCEFISIGLGWNKSADLVYRALTERILIAKLETQLNQLLTLEAYNSHHKHIQL